MNPEIKADWSAALRSGEYEQGTGCLARTNITSPTDRTPKTRYCCLGVLCELAVKAGVVSRAADRNEDEDYCTYGYGAGKESALLPNEVMEWAGLSNHNPILGPHADGDHECTSQCIRDQSASNRNDSNTSFATIANLIDEYL